MLPFALRAHAHIPGSAQPPSDLNVAHAGDISPWVLGTPRAAKTRPRTLHITPLNPDSTRKIWAMQVAELTHQFAPLDVRVANAVRRLWSLDEHERLRSWAPGTVGPAAGPPSDFKYR